MIPNEVLEGLEAVRKSGKTNMFDRLSVMVIASEMELYKTVTWLHENPKEYLKFMGGGGRWTRSYWKS